jgi:hypothetical protein
MINYSYKINLKSWKKVKNLKKKIDLNKNEISFRFEHNENFKGKL